ncbi:MAG TPA: methyltransferase domain-containing protein [Amphiplicatus sp.]|nr:methyltransferase domain-containing protein [Amphiplicatus sp.]
MRKPSRSSGDLIADRRYSYGLELAQAGDHAAAIDLFEQTIERAPNWPPAWLALARARREHFDGAGSIAAFRECLRLDPADALGAGLELSRLDASVTLDAAPAAYVAQLFDAYAPSFDKALVERLHYSGPWTLARMIRAHAPQAAPHRFARALDLGCGTGLAGEALRGDVGYLEGVDLAPGMIEVAKSKSVYDALAEGDVLSALLAREDRFNLIIASDVFTYIGDLARLFTSMRARLAPGGFAAFTVEKAEEEESPAGWLVRESLRFAHSVSYLRRLAAVNGLAVIAMEETALRKDRGADIAGLAIVLTAPRAETVHGLKPKSDDTFDRAPPDPTLH